MLNLVTENDALYCDVSTNDIITELLPLYGEGENFKKELKQLFARAKKNQSLESYQEEIIVGYSEEEECYFLVHKNFYEPRNLMMTLYEKLLAEAEEEYNEACEKGELSIDLYINKVQDMESVDLGEEKTALKTLAREMYKMFHILSDRDYTDEELEGYYDELEEQHLEPIAEMLEAILLKIIDVKDLEQG